MCFFDIFVYLFLLVDFCWICLDVWGPRWSPTPPSLASMSKFPSRRKTYERNICLVIFWDLLRCFMSFWDCWGFLWVLGVQNGPPPSPYPASMSQFPSRGNKYEKKKLFSDALWFLWKIERCIKMLIDRHWSTLIDTNRH